MSSSITPPVVTGTPVPTNDVTPAPPPPPPPSMEMARDLWPLPPGWTTARHIEDGRVYYWEVSTGRTSWTHPMAGTVSSETYDPTKQNDKSNHFKNPTTTTSMPPPPTTYGNSFANSQDMWSNQQTRIGLLDTPGNASRRPESHQCCAIASVILCFPLGFMALYHSIKVDSAWREGRYGDSVDHSRQAYNFGSFACVLGVILGIWWLFRQGIWEWPDFNFGFG